MRFLVKNNLLKSTHLKSFEVPGSPVGSYILQTTVHCTVPGGPVGSYILQYSVQYIQTIYKVERYRKPNKLVPSSKINDSKLYKHSFH